jgi:TadE-like protein
MARWKRTLFGSGGSEIAEAALVLPIAFMVLLAIYWFGRAFNIYGTINRAAQEGVRVGVAQTCGSCGNAPPLSTAIANQVVNALQASHLNASQVIPISPVYLGCAGGSVACSTSSNIYICTNVQLVAAPPGSSGPPACGVSLDFEYPYQMTLPFTSISNRVFKLSAHVQMRSEQ